MSTRAQLRTQVRDEIVEPSPGFVSNDEIDRWLNDGLTDLIDVAGIEASSTQSITTVNGTEAYALASGVGVVERVELLDKADTTEFVALRPMSVQERIDGKGSPVGFYVRDGKLVLTPVPDDAYVLRVFSTRAGVTLDADSDVPIIPSRYQRLLVKYAVGESKRKGDDPAFVTYRQDYVAGREGMVSYLRDRGMAAGHRIIDVDEPTGDGL